MPNKDEWFELDLEDDTEVMDWFEHEDYPKPLDPEADIQLTLDYTYGDDDDDE
jgi:hypothetical protein